MSRLRETDIFSSAAPPAREDALIRRPDFLLAKQLDRLKRRVLLACDVIKEQIQCLYVKLLLANSGRDGQLRRNGVVEDPHRQPMEFDLAHCRMAVVERGNGASAIELLS